MWVLSPEQEWSWSAALGHGVEFGLFPPAWLGWVVLLGQGHNYLSMSLPFCKVV